MAYPSLTWQTDSVFAREYAAGTPKSKYWEHTYEDMLNLLARLPEVRRTHLIWHTTLNMAYLP
eukprot:6961831-Prymnesium_polylepis.1